MASAISGKSKFMLYNTMCCLLKALEGMQVKVDLRNYVVIEGRLDSVESTMSLNMTNVVLTNAKGVNTSLSKFYVQGRQIVYVHIPDQVDILKAMTMQLSRKSRQQQRERNDTKRVFEKRQKLKKQRQKQAEKKERSNQPSTSMQ